MTDVLALDHMYGRRAAADGVVARGEGFDTAPGWSGRGADPAGGVLRRSEGRPMRTRVW